MAKQKKNETLLARNRKASHEYHLLRRLEAGLVLLGPEVKSARAGKVNLKEAFIQIQQNEAWLYQAHFSPYTYARSIEIDPVRKRKLLLHAEEIAKLHREITAGGMTLVPTKLYMSNGKIKIEIALAKGKKLHDKRESSKRQDAKREMDRAQSSRVVD